MTDVVHTYWLHVQEIKTDYEPVGLPSLRVEVIRTPEGLVEQTTLHDVRLGRDEWQMVQPHGRGWTLHTVEQAKCTTWRRAHHAIEFEKQNAGTGQGGS
jgi:hypothetical protein